MENEKDLENSEMFEGNYKMTYQFWIKIQKLLTLLFFYQQLA